MFISIASIQLSVLDGQTSMRSKGATYRSYSVFFQNLKCANKIDKF